MRRLARDVITFLLISSAFPRAQDTAAQLNAFVIARHTFFDVGPPTDFYELFFVEVAQNGTSVEKISLTPAGDACLQPAKVEVARGLLSESIPDLLGKTDPCVIPEKELHRELKRCKKCLLFSGANITMQMECRTKSRILRADILDRDMFNPHATTPEYTSWTMRLLDRIDHVVGPGPLDRPMFPLTAETKNETTTQDSVNLVAIASGKYDDLFQTAPDKPSDLYRESQIGPPAATVRLVSSSPFQPIAFIAPTYPPLARVVHVSGTVSFTVDVTPDGSATGFTIENGHPMLRGATQEAVSKWNFPKEAGGQKIHAAIEFATNCSIKK
jgi:hypothetical protein